MPRPRKPPAFVVALLVVAVSGAVATAAPPSSTYKLVFADEFNASGLDTMKWIDAYPWGRTHNHEAYMASSNVLFPGDGTLTLKAERVPQGGKYFTSGAVSTGYTIEKWDGGYFEARIRLPTRPGSWPAFWGLDTGWPPEADIMEFPITTDGTSGFPITKYNTEWHYTDTSGNPAKGAGGVDPPGIDALNTDYHTFGMEWTSDTSAAFYFDGAQVSSFSNAAAIKQMTSMYLILNYAVGGWPGFPSLTQWPAGESDQTKFDYVRVYQKPAVGGTISFSGTAAIGSWDTAAAWAGGVPKFEDQTVALGANTAASGTFTWSQARTIGGIAFSSTTTAYTLGGTAGSLQFARSSGTPTISLSAANTRPQTIASRIELYETTTAITNDSTQPLTLSGTIVGEGGLTVDGTGTVIFANNNTYTGPTVIDAGGASAAVARVTRSRPFGTGTVTIGATGNATTARIEIQDGRTVPNTIAFSGRNNQSAGLLNLSGTNDFQGSIVANFGGSSYIIQSDAGLMRLSGTADGGVALTSAATGNRTFTLQGAGGGEVAGGITNGSGTVHLMKADSGTWTLSGSNSHSGTTTVQAGVLRIANARAVGTSPTVVTGGTLAMAGGVIPRSPSVLLAGGVLQASSLLVNGTSGIARLEVQGGGFANNLALSVSGSGAVVLPASATVDLQVGGLSVDQATGGRLDLGGSRISVAAGGITQAALLADLRSGLGTGVWDGDSGITSSLAAATPYRAVGWLGNADGSITIGFAAEGDTNLDGLVDLGDLQNILAAGKYGTRATATWADGDFNYDGVVDLADLQDILAAGLYGKGGYLPGSGPLLRALVGGQEFPQLAFDTLPADPALSAGSTLVAVPEPTGWVLVAHGLAAAAVCGWRRLGS